MADDIVSASESVYTEQICDNLILIDPNKIESPNGQSIEDRLVRHEDLVIYVNLTARVIARSKLIDGKGASDSGVKIDLFHGEINFLKPLNKKSLDTDWTEAFTDPSVNKIRRDEDTDDQGQVFYSKSIENKSDFQGFGITNIDIKISSSFVPQVTINFTDVRGKTLFEQAETNTPYTAFFHLPYPQFELTVKGYYGKAVKYQLALIQFNTNFDANSGDYQVTGTFIGNHIAMLNDINLQQAMLAPYLYPVIKQGTSDEKPPTGGIGRKIMGEVYDIYQKKKLIPDDFPRLTIFELIRKIEGFTDNLKKNFSKADLRFTNDQKKYQETLINFKNAILKGTQSWKDTFLSTEHMIPLNMTLGSTGNPETEGKNIVAPAFRLKSIEDQDIANAESKLKYIIEGYKQILSENVTFGLAGRAPINLIKDFSLENQRAENHSSKDSSKLKPDAKGWYVLETSHKSFLGVYVRVMEEFDKKYKEIQTEASNKLKTIFQQSLSFYPSIRNLMAIVIAGVDTYLRLMDRVHFNAMQQSKNEYRVRSVITNKKGYEDAVRGGKEVFPWPQYYQYNEDDNRYVLKYPGASGSLSETNADDIKAWPEVEFIEEYTKAINFKANQVPFPVSNDARYTKEIPLSVRQFPFIDTPYEHSVKNSILWEILDRALDFTSYVGISGFKARPDQINEVFLEGASNDSINLMKAIESDFDLQEFFKDNSLDWKSLLNELKTNSPDKFFLFLRGFVNTPYLNPIFTQPYDIAGTSYGLYPESSAKEIFTEGGKYLKYLILFLDSKKTQDWWHDFYPFNLVNINNLKSKLSDAANLTSEKFFQIDVLQMGTQTNVYMTSPNNEHNKSFYFSNLNWDLKTINGELIDIVKGDLDYITPFNPLFDWDPWNAYYKTKEDNIELQSLTEGMNYTSESFDSQVVSMLNTPWFANAIYKGFVNENASTPAPYAEAAYLFLNSLPLTSTLEKIITKYEGKHQYGAYVAQAIKQLAGYHELPYAFILKIGSLWWNYKNAPAINQRIFGGLGSGDGGTLGNDGDIRCNEWYVDQAYANGFGWYDYTYNGNIIPGLNTTEVTLGFWPRLIDVIHTIVTGKSILPAVGSWAPVADVNAMFTGIVGFELVKEEDLFFHKGGLDYNFYTTFIDSSTIGTKGLDDIDATTDPYYILYPSAGALVNTDLSFMGDNINTAGFDGSARFLWAGAGYGAFDVTQPGTVPLKYGAMYGRVPKSHYTKRIDTSTAHQQAWNINNTDNNITGYDDFTELLSVFPVEVLDEFEKQFLNFSETQNPDATIVEGQFTEFKTIFKELMVVEKDNVDGDNNITQPSGNITHKTQDIAKAQYKKFLNIGKIFLNQNIIYKHGSVNGWDMVRYIATDSISTKQLILHIIDSVGTDSAPIIDLPPYDASIYPAVDGAFITLIALNVIPTLEVGVNTQFTNVTKICFDFFVNFNIDPTLVQQFAPILKQYVTETFRTTLTATNGITKSDFKNRLETYLDNIDAYTEAYMGKFFNSVKGLDTRKGLKGAGEDGDDSRPKIVADSLKLELYQVFKTFNDKWIAGTDVKEVDVGIPSPTSVSALPNYNTQFEKFMFLDRTNTDIGNDAVIDIYQFLGLDTPFTENPNTSVKQNIGGFVSTLCSKNFFNFIPLPSYVNFYNIEEHDTKGQGNAMFGTFKEVDYALSSPKYLCQYIGPPSTSLDIKTMSYGYNNDSFVLNRVSPNPLCKGVPKGEEEKNLSNKLVAFAVDFGIPNQNVFESIALDQSEFPNTSEVFRIMEDMGKMASGSKVSTNSLNLFNLYKSRSYKCQVTSMGNALIQPTTYFQLRYVPMFSGPYLIMDVNHNISPNTMTTTFTGVRVGIPSLPQITDLIASIQETLIKSMDEDLEDTELIDPIYTLDPHNLTPPEVDNMTSNDDISTLPFSMVDPVVLSKINKPIDNQIFWVERKKRGGGTRRHKGIDYSPKTEFQGTDIDLVSPVTGIIVEKNTGCIAGSSETAKSCAGGYGNSLIIQKTLIESSDISSYVANAVTKYQFRMAHIKEKTITSTGIDSSVNKGAKIGVMGTTGNSDGVHLHYEIIKWELDDNLKEQKYYLNPNQFSSEYLEPKEDA